MTLRIYKGYKNNYNGVSLQNLINLITIYVDVAKHNYVKQMYLHTHTHTTRRFQILAYTTDRMRKPRGLLPILEQSGKPHLGFRINEY